MKVDYQQAIFDEIKRKIKGQDSLGNIIGDVLSISQDAVYRRYRGETLLTIFEIEKLCKKFEISMDALFNMNKNKVVFDFQPLDGYDFSMDSYLADVRDSLLQVKSQTDPELVITINNIPFLQLLNYPHLVRFKLFFWAKTYLQIDEFKDIQFEYEKINPESFSIGLEALKIYNTIPSKEIYDLELMRGLTREIYTAYNSHQFKDPKFALYLFEVMDRFLDHLKAQMDVGKKFVSTTEPPAQGNEFEVYLNEVSNANSTIYYKTKEYKGLAIAHNFMSTLHTSDKEYLEDTEGVIERQLNNSNLISVINEKERNKFFFQLKNMVDSYRKKIQLDLEM